MTVCMHIIYDTYSEAINYLYVTHLWIGSFICTSCFKIGFQIKVLLTLPHPAIPTKHNAEIIEVSEKG